MSVAQVHATAHETSTRSPYNNSTYVVRGIDRHSSRQNGPHTAQVAPTCGHQQLLHVDVRRRHQCDSAGSGHARQPVAMALPPRVAVSPTTTRHDVPFHHKQLPRLVAAGAVPALVRSMESRVWHAPTRSSHPQL